MIAPQPRHGCWLPTEKALMFNPRLLSAVLIGLITTAAAQDTIVYRQGPLPLDSFFHRMDLNEDGIEDYEISGLLLVSLPSPGFPVTLTPFVVARNFNRNDFLTGPDIYGNLRLKEAGYVFGPETMPGEFWGRRDGQIVSIAYSHWTGFSGQPPEAYLGVRFLSGGRQHYGWIHFIVPTVQSGPAMRAVFPVIADWAYEARQDTPILAGDAGTNVKPVWFTVDFQNSDGTLHGCYDDSLQFCDMRRSTGAFALAGDTLSYVVTLAGSFPSVEICRSGRSRVEGKPVWRSEDPLVQLANFTLFFGETKLTRSQANRLRLGPLYASLDGGAVVGQIVRVHPERKRTAAPIHGHAKWLNEFRAMPVHSGFQKP